MRFILLEFERIVKIPRDVEVIKTRMPKGFEKTRFTIRRIISVIIERSL